METRTLRATLHSGTTTAGNGTAATNPTGGGLILGTLSGSGAITASVVVEISAAGSVWVPLREPERINGAGSVPVQIYYSTTAAQVRLRVVDITGTLSVGLYAVGPAISTDLEPSPDGSASIAGPLRVAGGVASVGGVSTYTDFTILADGPVPAKHDDFPLPIRTYYPTASAVPFVVRDGRLQSDTENAGKTTVCYTETDLVGQVSAIGADISFKSNGGEAGTIALCAWGDSSLVDSFALGRIPTTGCHFIIQRGFWSYQIWDHNGAGTQLVTLKTGNAPLIPQDETTTFRVEIKFDGDSAIVSFPEYGYSQRITDSRIRTLGRRYACWETYQLSGTSDKPQFARIWASSARQAEMASSAVIPGNQARAVMSATDGNKTISETSETAASEIDANTYIEFVVPASGKVLLRYTAMFDQTTPGTVLMDLAVVDGGGGNLAYTPVQISNAVAKGVRTAAAVYSNPAAAGARRFFRPRAWILGAGAACTISRSVAGGIRPVLEVIPLV